MSISYSALTNYGKATLPSVDSWGTNLTILKDPPKSIHTRKINKVGENNDITQMIEDSGNRTCEAITHYARGVNPMLSVSYSNYGNNGGQRSGGIQINGGRNAKLPYNVMEGGVFRPPVQRPVDLLPLSRLPRNITKVNSNIEFIDYTKKAIIQGQACDYRQVHNNTLKGNVRPTAIYNIETPIKENFEVKYVIQNPIMANNISSGTRTQDITQQNVKEPTGGILDPVHYSWEATKGSKNTVTHINNSTLNTDKYLQETIHSNVKSNIYNNIKTTPIEDLVNLDIKIKDKMNISYTAPTTSTTNVKYIHNDKELTKKLPYYKTRTNISKNIHKQTEYENEIELKRRMPIAKSYSNVGATGKSIELNLEKTYNRLPRKPSYGGFLPTGTQPTTERVNPINNSYESDKSIMSRKVYGTMQERYTH